MKLTAKDAILEYLTKVPKGMWRGRSHASFDLQMPWREFQDEMKALVASRLVQSDGDYVRIRK